MRRHPRTYFSLYASKMNSVICRSLDNDITDIAAYVSVSEREGKGRASENDGAVFRNGPVIIMIVIINVTLYLL